MAISTDVKVDHLWKKFFGTTKTADGAIKFASNETIASISPVLPTQVWGQAGAIPDTAPAVSDEIVEVFTGANAIRMTADPTSPANVAWLATADYGDVESRLTDFIPYSFGSSYAAKVWIGDPNVGPAARIFPDATNEEWVFDPAAGVVIFDNNIPANRTATVGSGTVSVATDGIYLEVCQYVGTRFPYIPNSIGDLSDVDISTSTPAEGDILVYRDGVFQAEAFPADQSGATELSELTDVDLSTGTPQNGAALVYRDGIWQAEVLASSGVSSLNDLTDVDLSTGTPNEGDVLTYKDGIFQAETPVAPTYSLNDLTDVDTSTGTPNDGDVLTYRDGIYQNETPEPVPHTLTDLEDVDLSTGTPSNGDVLTYRDGIFQAETPSAAGASDGFALPLGDVAADGDGSWSPGAVPLTNSTPVSEAVDMMNEILYKLVPETPPAFPNGGTLTISNSAGTSPRLASGVTDNSGSSTLSAGDAVTRVTGTTINTNTFGDVGPGDTGTVEFIINSNIIGQVTLTGSGDNGSYNGLVIADQKGYPVSNPNFWKSIDVSGTGVLGSQVGINAAIIQHSAASNTGYTYYVRDDLNSAPVISSASVTEETQGSLAYSSSIPHYGTGAQLAVNASVSNLAGQTYYGGTDPFTISGTNSIISSDFKTFANLGISTPIAAGTTTATAISEQIVDIDGTNVHNSGTIQGVARNVAGASAAANLSSTIILVKRGTAGARVDENSVTVTGLGSSPNANNAVRVSMGSGDKPALTTTAWDSSAALATHEATVSGGVLKHDQTNYASGYLPVGPDLSSGRSGAQYATFSFERTARSAFKIAITGTYAGCWVALPGVSDAQPNGSGWWDMFQSYDGSGIPGETGDTNAGCALGTVMSGASGTFQATFGTASSTNSTDNEILVRVKLNAGQSITALSFTN